MEETMNLKVKRAVKNGAIDFALNSKVNCFDYKAIEVKDKGNNYYEIYIPIIFENIHVNENTFFNYFNTDLHYMPIMFGTEIIDEEIVTKHGLYYKVGNKITPYMSDICFKEDEKIIFSLMEETDENEELEYRRICTIQVIFQSNEI